MKEVSVSWGEMQHPAGPKVSGHEKGSTVVKKEKKKRAGGRISSLVEMAGAVECIWISSRRNTCNAHPSIHHRLPIHLSIHPQPAILFHPYPRARGPFALCQAILIPIYHLFHSYPPPFLSSCSPPSSHLVSLSLSLFSPKPFDSNSFLSPLLSSPLLLLPFSSLHAVYPFPPRRHAGAVTSRTSLSRVFLFLNRLPWRREGWREILKERSSFSTGVCRQSSKHPARNRRTRFITHDEQTVDGLGRGLAACVSFAERLIVALRSV